MRIGLRVLQVRRGYKSSMFVKMCCAKDFVLGGILRILDIGTVLRGHLMKLGRSY